MIFLNPVEMIRSEILKTLFQISTKWGNKGVKYKATFIN